MLRIVLGLILLTAAALKGHQLATEPVAETSLFTSRWFLIGVVELELFFGLWLFSGLYASRDWQVAMFCFSAFAWVSLYKAVSDEASCRYFGKVPVNPTSQNNPTEECAMSKVKYVTLLPLAFNEGSVLPKEIGHHIFGELC